MTRAKAVAALVLAALAFAPAAAAEPRVAPRIINGTEADPGTYGYTVALIDVARYGKQGVFQAQFCGGTLTTPTKVVTAAHCVMKAAGSTQSDPGEILVGFGHTLDNGLRLVPVASVAVHPNYNARKSQNDIAVLTLATPVTDITPIAPVRPEEAAPYVQPGASAIVTGWGNTQPTGNHYPNGLNYATLTVFPDGSCGGQQQFTLGGVTFQGFSPSAADARIMLCADGVTASGGVIDTCQGDSGGPLVGGNGPSARLIGVTSWGENCSGEYPGVYTRVSAMTDFLAAQDAFSAAPATAFSATVQPLNGALRVVLTPPPASSAVTGYGVAVTDPATGAVSNCFAAPTANGIDPYCTVTGLINDTPYSVSAIYATAAGNSEPTPPAAATPIAVPDPGRITRAKQLDRDRIKLTLTKPSPGGAPIDSRSVRCTSLSTGQVKSGRAVGTTATVKGMKPGRYSCTIVATNAIGSGISDPRLVMARR